MAFSIFASLALERDSKGLSIVNLKSLVGWRKDSLALRTFALSISAALSLTLLSGIAIAQVPPPGIQNNLFDRPDFFEDGLEQMEDEIRQLQQSDTSQPTLTIGDELLQWQPTILREAGFGVWMPQGVTTEETELLELDEGGELVFDVLASHVASARYVVAYSYLAERQDRTDSQVVLKNLRDSIVDRTNYALAGDRSISLNNRYPGREFSMAGNGERLTFRAYAIGNQLVVLAGGQPEVQQNSQAVETFLESLQLLQ